MKRLICLILALTVLVAALCGCSKPAEHFTGQWKYSAIRSVEIVPSADEDLIRSLKEDYGAADEAGVESAALSEFLADGTFSGCYLHFDGSRAYTYDPVMEREATWAFYRTGDGEGFLSMFAELDAADGNPDPANNPAVAYEAKNGVMLLVLKYAAFMVTLELTA